MTRIAFIHNSFPAGGAERITIDIARYLASYEENYEIYVYTTKLSEELMTEDISKYLTVRLIPSDKQKRDKAEKVERLVIQDKIDILVQVTKKLYGIDGIRLRTGCKVILSNHGEPFWQKHAIMYRRRNSPLKRLLWSAFNRKRYEEGGKALRMAISRSLKEYNSCDAYTVLCEEYKKEIAEGFRIDQDKSHIYAIGNSERTVENISLKKEKIILFCGRLDPWAKRVDRLLRIWKNVQNRLPEWQLMIVGDGPKSKELEKQAIEDKLVRISFEGSTRDVASYYAKASIVCLTSESEGWGLSMTEGQANGCIPIAFGCSAGVRKILSPDGINGIIVAPFDENEYADRLIALATLEEEKMMEMRRNVVKKISDYSPDIISQKWKNLFDILHTRNN